MAGREKDIDDILNEDVGASGVAAPEPKADAKAARPKPARRSVKTSVTKEVPAPSAPPAPADVELARDEPAPQKRRSAWPLILGLALLGAAAYAGWQAPRWLGQTDQVAALNASLTEVTVENDQLKASIADLQSRLAALEERPTSASVDEIAAIGQSVESAGPRLDQLEGMVGKLGERLTALERAAATAPDGSVPDAALAGLQSQLDRLKAETDDHIAALEATVQSLAEAPAPDPAEPPGRDALAQIGAALQSGAPYATALVAYSETAEPSDALETLAQHSNGVATLSELQAAFPDAARDALIAARSSPEATSDSGFTGFLKGQLGMRSLTPQDGADADAILSRAEAALGAGDLGAALTELAALPGAARAELGDWLIRAEARQAALTAFATLSNSGG